MEALTTDGVVARVQTRRVPPFPFGSDVRQRTNGERSASADLLTAHSEETLDEVQASAAVAPQTVTQPLLQAVSPPAHPAKSSGARPQLSIQGTSLEAWLDQFIPRGEEHDAEIRRRTHLFIAFSFLGMFFGMLFAAFYLAIGHPWGADIVLGCTGLMGFAPWIIRAAGLERTGNVYAMILVVGFSGLTAIEGGIHGHAVAWLAVVPLCACLLVNRRMGWRWCVVCLLVMASFCVMDMIGLTMPSLYPARWERTITSAGYVCLTIFMSLLGVSFENGRRRSLNNLHTALDALSLAREQSERARIEAERAKDEAEFAKVEAEHAKDEAESAKDEAERANRAKSDFLSRMSHELRTPLNAILGFGEFLKAQETREMSRDCLGHIVQAGSHLLGLINEVLDISRIESGNIALCIAPVRVERMVEEALDLIRGAAHERRVVLHWAPNAVAARCVLADAGRFKQVLLNLLSNAVKYNVEGGVVNIVCLARDDGQICVEVADTGLGIPSEKMRRLFVAFDRLGAENSGVQGTGLGLALSKCLMEALKGSLEVESEPGIGSVFRVSLPAAPDDQKDAVPPPSAKLAPAKRTTISFTGKHRVLYIEDDDANFRLVQRLLDTHPGITLTRGATAGAGLEEIMREVPDLLLLDLHLPDLSGDQVLALLRKDPRTQAMPIIIMTADATRISIDKLMAAGANDYITKPLDLRTLLATMRKWLEEVPGASGPTV